MNEKIKEQIIAAKDNGRLGHAYLFIGEAGTGKLATALEIASVYLGVSKTEFEKNNCTRFQHIIPPLLVDKIREMNEIIRAGRGEKTVTVIEGVEEMTNISFNTMLKTLEEPPLGALIILLATTPVLATVMSRCITYRFCGGEPEFSEEVQALTREFGRIYSEPRKIEEFVGEIGRDFDKARQILLCLISMLREKLLADGDFSQVSAQRANKYAKAIDDAMLSVKKSSPLLMVFGELSIKLTGVFNDEILFV